MHILKFRFIFQGVITAFFFAAFSPAIQSAEQVVSQVAIDGSWLEILNLASDYVEKEYKGAVKANSSKIAISDCGDYFSVQFLLPKRIRLGYYNVDEVEVTIIKKPRPSVEGVTTRTLAAKSKVNLQSQP